MPPFKREHIVFTDRTQKLPYTSVSSGRSPVITKGGVNRVEHGNKILNDFNVAVNEFKQGVEHDFIYLTFKSELDFLLDLDKFQTKDFHLSTYRRVDVIEDETPHYYYEATVRLNKKAVSKFLNKLNDYIDIKKNTPPTYYKDGTIKSAGGNPLNQSLVSNIAEIRAATLESFWQEPEIPFPNHGEEVWWEVWLDRSIDENIDNPISTITPALEAAEIQIGDKHLIFPEHYVYLMKGSVEQLGASLLYTDKLAEIRKPKDTAEFFTYLSKQEQAEWIEDLRGRVDHHDSSISVCLLDTGVNRINPLLENLLAERNLDVVNPAWGTADTHNEGHGTAMAGLILYGDLTEALATAERIQIYHHLESVKLINQSQPHIPELYGAVTQEAVSRGEILNPNHKRVVCMAVTSDHAHRGRPSSWSSAIDQIIFGSINEANNRLLFFVSSGNVSSEERINYPLVNDDENNSIQDPAQSFNAITVGAYTLKDQIDLNLHPGAILLATRGNMSASNTTSISWLKDWSRKPDIVMEGGNQALANGTTLDPDSLQLLSTSKGGVGRPWLTSFSDTSASTALASKFAAEIFFHYPNLWPETIRGLVIHSADWTSAMLKNRPIQELTPEERIKLIQRVGYGVPNMEKARYSANNSLSLIAERTLKPYKKDRSEIKTEDFHLFDLPWPVQVLQELLGTPVKLKITLSYFIEPNPGNKKYELAASYRSCGLRFKIIDSTESPDAFKARVSKAMREEDYEAEGGEDWILGNKVRDKGSIHKDIWEGTAADLATRNRIAIYPVGGWWKTRKNLKRFDNSIRYSLIVTIDAPNQDIDIYTPVLNQIPIEV